jgi:micrococcal nuclease
MHQASGKRKTVNLISIIFFILAASVYFVHEQYPFLRIQQGDRVVPVIIVHDGDTLSVLINKKQEKVRMIGIDAPEIGQKPWGDEAKRHLEKIINTSGRKVKIEFDVEKTDQYGRILAYIRTTDGSMINLLMIRGGYAVLYTVPPNVKYAEDFRKGQAEAREKGLGMWSEGGLWEKPQDYRKEHPRI